MDDVDGTGTTGDIVTDEVAEVDDTSVRGDDAETKDDTISEEVDVNTDMVVITDEVADENDITFIDRDGAGGETTVEGEKDIESDSRSGPLPLPLPMPLPLPEPLPLSMTTGGETEEEDGAGTINIEDGEDGDITLDTEIDKTSYEDAKQSHNTNCSFGIFNYRKGQSTS